MIVDDSRVMVKTGQTGSLARRRLILLYLFDDQPVNILFLSRREHVSIECRKIKTNTITLANHEAHTNL